MGSINTSRMKVEDDDGQLGIRSRLEKIDKLRELAIDIDLPQVRGVMFSCIDNFKLTCAEARCSW